jgi:hypothetical protein
MIVRNAVDNTYIDSATVVVWMDINSARDGKTNFQTNPDGKVEFPILANGVYNIEISKEGFMTLTRTFTVNVQPGDCAMYEPIDLTPLSPSPLCERGARVSLTWGEHPSDLDLYSYRVNNNDTTDECLTYYCDGKDPCNGTTHDVDNKNGGLNGAETITYCNTEDYVNMIFVDDLAGRGSSLLSSTAKLVIQANNQSVEVHLNTKDTDESDEKRYWLAGCLLLEDYGFIFLEVNEMRDEQPSIDNPHFCYNLVQLKRQSEAEDALPNANLIVNVKKENTIFFASSIELKTPSGLSRHQPASSHGTSSFPIYENGWYEVIVRAPGYSPAVEKIKITCNHTEVLCSSAVHLTLSALKPEGNIKILLNWEEDLNLDLHTVQIDKESTSTHCETFYGQQASCTGSLFGSDIKVGGMPAQDEGEAILLENVANNPTLTYMVFVHDNSVKPNLNSSNTRLALLDGIKEEWVTMPASTVSEAEYWFAGCVAIVGDFFHFVAVNKFSRTNPVETEKLHCVELFKRAPPPSTPAFCMGKTLKINIRNSENNTDINDAKIDIVRVKGQHLESINVTSAMIASDKLSLEGNGIYKVDVYRQGFQTGSNEVSISCDINKCNQCDPSITIPMVGAIRNKHPRVVLVWQKERKNPGLYAIQRNMETGVRQCVSRNNKKCNGVTVNAHNQASKENNFKTMSIGSKLRTNIKYYTIVVNLKSDGNGNEVVDETIKKSKVHVIVTDSYGASLRVNMRTQTYKKDKYWIVGCMGGEYMVTASFTEINQFLDSPPEDGVDYCKHFLSKGKYHLFF